MAQIYFDSTAVEPSTYSVLPKGKYLSMAIASEMKSTKRGDGQYLQITFEVIDGDFKGRKIFDRMNIRNPNPTAQKIAEESLSALCRAVGVEILQDSDQLHNIPLVLDVNIEAGKDGYEDKNTVKGYSSASAQSAAPRAQAPAAAAPAAAPAAKATPVWKKPKA